MNLLLKVKERGHNQVMWPEIEAFTSALNAEKEKGWTAAKHLLGASQVEDPYVEGLNLQRFPWIRCRLCPVEIQGTTPGNLLDPLAPMEYVEPSQHV